MIKSFISKFGKEKFAFILIIIIVLIIMGLYQTFSLLTDSAGISYSNNTKTYQFVIGGKEENEILISENDSKYIDVLIKNDKELTLSYALYYNLDKDNNDITIGYLKESNSKPSGTILDKETKVISLKIINNSNNLVKITLGINNGIQNGGELKKSGERITKEIANLDKENVNEPELDNNLIPVYYDAELNKWLKADESNTNEKYKWYNYAKDEKIWANAVIVTDNTRSNYLNNKPGTIINDQDILAFFVWIPRYKYQVWNVTRNILNENNYIYSAKEKGINIKFEAGSKSTGNLNCTYNKNIKNEKNDICKIDNTIINTNIEEEIWYTHPAFTYGGKEITGLWIGKFETTGGLDKPTILPNQKAIRNINISTGFNLAKKINEYNSNSNIDAHLIKNIEWGAIAYLSHSDYGYCQDESCAIPSNNSKLGITGRSSGNTNSKESSDEGNYTYDGFQIVDNNKTNDFDISKISSTTKTIYGVYDLLGGLKEFSMGNMINDNKSLNIKESGNEWNNTNYLSTKYYDIYSNNSLTNSRIGDATSEVTLDNNKTWNSNKDQSFINSDYPWFVRGNNYEEAGSIFDYNNSTGDKNTEYGLRIVLS